MQNRIHKRFCDASLYRFYTQQYYTHFHEAKIKTNGLMTNARGRDGRHNFGLETSLVLRTEHHCMSYVN